ncbi:hypothetical protein ABE10_01825, partial [Bacillus toyonensis]|nr:hypothetical protein [Bacillus toyonensis]
QGHAGDERDRDEVRHERGEHVRPQHARPRDRHRLEPLEDAALQIEEEPVGRVGDAGGDRDQEDSRQHVVDVGPFHAGPDRPAEDE